VKKFINKTVHLVHNSIYHSLVLHFVYDRREKLALYYALKRPEIISSFVVNECINSETFVILEGLVSKNLINSSHISKTTITYIIKSSGKIIELFFNAKIISAKQINEEKIPLDGRSNHCFRVMSENGVLYSREQISDFLEEVYNMKLYNEIFVILTSFLINFPDTPQDLVETFVLKYMDNYDVYFPIIVSCAYFLRDSEECVKKIFECSLEQETADICNCLFELHDISNMFKVSEIDKLFKSTRLHGTEKCQNWFVQAFPCRYTLGKTPDDDVINDVVCKRLCIETKCSSCESDSDVSTDCAHSFCFDCINKLIASGKQCSQCSHVFENCFI
jgi:hypothetical protein